MPKLPANLLPFVKLLAAALAGALAGGGSVGALQGVPDPEPCPVCPVCPSVPVGAEDGAALPMPVAPVPPGAP